MDSVRHDINSKFTERCSPMGATATRGINPFVSTGTQNADTKRDEMKVRPSVSIPPTLGAQYKEYLVDTKDDDSVRLDTYTIRENPKSNTLKYATSRLEVEHTRER